MSAYKEKNQIGKIIGRLLPDAGVYSQYLKSSMFNPAALIVSVIIFTFVSFAAFVWVRNDTIFENYSFDALSANLSSAVADQAKVSEKLISGFEPESPNGSWQFSEKEWGQLSSRLKALKGTHLVSGAWYVKVEARPEAEPDPDKLYKKTTDTRVIISSLPIDKEVDAQPYPQIAGTWDYIQGKLDTQSLSEGNEFVVDAAYRAARSGSKISFRKSSDSASIIMAAPVYCEAKSSGGKACYESVVYEIDTQLAIDSLLNKHIIPDSVSVGFYWSDSSQFTAAHPPMLSRVASPGRLGILERTSSIALGTERFNIYYLRDTRLSGAVIRKQYLPVILLCLLAAVLCFYLLVVSFVIYRRVQRDKFSLLTRRLEAKDRQLTTLSDASPFGIIITGKSNKCIYANAAAAELFNKPQGELSGDKWLKSIPKEARAEFLESIADPKILREAEEVDVAIKTSESNISECSVTILPLYQGDSVLGKTLIFHNNTDIKKISQELERLKSQRNSDLLRVKSLATESSNLEVDLKEKTSELIKLKKELYAERLTKADNPRVQSGFLSSLREELRTPISRILETVTELQDSSEGETVIIEASEDICKDGEVVLGIIDDLLDFSKIDSRKVDVEKIACSPTGILDEIDKIALPLAEEANISYGREHLGELPSSIVTDRFRLRKVLQHLINNAISNTKFGGVKVCVRFEKGSSDVQYEVVDTGSGMSDELAHAAFVDESKASPRIKASASGLINTRKMVIEMGGSISVDTKEGRGTTVEVSIPIQAAKSSPRSSKGSGGKKGGTKGSHLKVKTLDKKSLNLKKEKLSALAEKQILKISKAIDKIQRGFQRLVPKKTV